MGMWEFGQVFLFLSGRVLFALREMIPLTWLGNGDVWRDFGKSYEVRTWVKCLGERWVVNFRPIPQGVCRHFKDAMLSIDQKDLWGTRGLLFSVVAAEWPAVWKADLLMPWMSAHRTLLSAHSHTSPALLIFL